MPYSRRETDIHNLPDRKEFRRELRSSLTPAEAALWQILRGSKLDGRKFRRQHSVGGYILDFYCPAEKLAIELDGQVHLSGRAREHDHARRIYLEGKGINVVRIENRYVFDDREWVVDLIRGNFRGAGGDLRNG